MKHVVVDEQLKEVEVHPPGLYQDFVEISVDSAGELLAQMDRFVETACPACGASSPETAFEKHGYHYWNCLTCASLYVSPRPSTALMNRYLLDSPIAAFRDSETYRLSMAQRAGELSAYRADWVSELCWRMKCGEQKPLIDVETRWDTYPAALAQRQKNPLLVVKPLLGDFSERVDNQSVTTVDELHHLAGTEAAIITAFDVLEHQADPLNFLQAAYDALEPGGLFVCTTRSGSGFDIQLLWEHATIFPVEHINLLSVEGMRALLQRTGFEIVEESTPGQLDVQLIKRILQEKPEIEVPRFVRYFMAHRDRYARKNLQQFLQQNLLSSYLRVVARKI
ncbi:MAG: methyltransferase domain-containing protein [Anaerolineae bacterium]|nr:methyltransferase domain-containing protein [Anaerolineae bacterium]